MLRAFRHFDTDGSGTISREELKAALKVGCSYCMLGLTAARALCIAGLHPTLTIHPSAPYILPCHPLQLCDASADAELDRLIAEADADGDGLINYHEFCMMMARRKF